jgi:hypothetical protein
VKRSVWRRIRSITSPDPPTHRIKLRKPSRISSA